MTKMIRGLENEPDARLQVKAIEVFSLKEKKERGASDFIIPSRVGKRVFPLGPPFP